MRFATTPDGFAAPGRSLLKSSVMSSACRRDIDSNKLLIFSSLVTKSCVSSEIVSLSFSISASALIACLLLGDEQNSSVPIPPGEDVAE